MSGVVQPSSSAYLLQVGWLSSSLPSDVQESHVFGVPLNELLAAVDVIAHEDAHHIVGENGLFCLAAIPLIAVVPLLGELGDADPIILLIRQYRYAAEKYLYEIPAGRLDPGESPADCAHRELREETGYSAARVEQLFTMFTTPGFTDEKIHLFLATGLVAGKANREADEFMELVPTPLSRALAMIEQGEIQDAKTALALLYAADFRIH